MNIRMDSIKICKNEYMIIYGICQSSLYNFVQF